MPYSNPQNSPSLNKLLSLKNKSALVVGGSGLLGSEISFVLAELGAKITVASRNLKKNQKFIEDLNYKYPNNHSALKVDLKNDKSIKSLFKDYKNQNKSLDILVNSGWSGNKNSFESISFTDWENDIDISLNSVFKTIKTFFPLLKKNKGIILNISSMYGKIAPDYRIYDGKKFTNPPSYGSAKAGIIQLTKYLSSFLAPHSIRVNSLSPGPFPYESTQKENPKFIDKLGEKNTLNRIGFPHEIKGIVAVLCSDAGSYINGQDFSVDGGWTIW